MKQETSTNYLDKLALHILGQYKCPICGEANEPAPSRNCCLQCEADKRVPPQEEWDDLGITSRCTCEEYAWGEHTCPFQEEIHDDYEFTCECCPWHTYQCALEI